MLLTLAVESITPLLRNAPGGAGKLRLEQVPRFARETLGLHGLNLSTALLAGADRATLTQLRESADKAGCPCLVLAESEPQPLASFDDDPGEAAIARMLRVLEAAAILGCSSVAVAVAEPDSDDEHVSDLAVERVKQVLRRAEKMEINLLLRPYAGLTADPESMREFIKRIGGFRIGTFPDFLAASESDDPITYLRRLTPYASSVVASAIRWVEAPGEPLGWRHEPYDLLEMVGAVSSVGYEGTLAIHYRGAENIEQSIQRTRQALEQALGMAGEDD